MPKVAPMGLGALFLTINILPLRGFCDNFLSFPVVTFLEAKFSFYPADYAKGKSYHHKYSETKLLPKTWFLMKKGKS